MYAWLLRCVVEQVFARLGAGDASLASALVGDQLEFHFPGRTPWTAHAQSKDEAVRWLRRFAHFRPQFEIHDIIASGPPWDIRGCFRFTDRIGDQDDPNPYVNEGVCMFRLRNGRLVENRIFLDTQAVADFFGTESPEEFFGGVPALS